MAPGHRCEDVGFRVDLFLGSRAQGLRVVGRRFRDITPLPGSRPVRMLGSGLEGLVSGSGVGGLGILHRHLDPDPRCSISAPSESHTYQSSHGALSEGSSEDVNL